MFCFYIINVGSYILYGILLDNQKIKLEMTNTERYEARYQRRKEKRLKKRIENERKLSSFDKAISIDELTKSFYKCKKGVSWKRSVQNFEDNLFQNISELHSKMIKDNYTTKGYVEFELWERGKKRKIQACHISERVIQKSFAENCLEPILNKTLIRNNCASQKGKGTSKALEYFEEDLKKAYEKYGRNFYIIQGDFHNYFASIPHDKLIEQLDKYFFDERTRFYYRKVINSFYEGDECIGLGLGSQVCQNFAVFYPNKLDHYMEQFGSCGRFNDDFYLIVETKQQAKEILIGMQKIVDELGLELNKKKTKIIKATHSITYLKTKFNILENGEILKRPYRKNITRERRKLKKLKAKLDNGEIEFNDVRTSYNSWKGSLKGKKCYETTKSMDDLFNKLFIEDWRIEWYEQTG